MKISVVIPTYNREQTLKRAIDSVLAQRLQASEIIVVDDGSTDNSFSVLKEYPQVKVVSQANKGVSAARNTGIACSSNEWMAFLDSDDEWHVDKLLVQADYHKTNPQYKLSYTNEKWLRHNKEMKIPKRHIKQKNPSFLSSLKHCQIGPSTVVMHKSVIEDIGLFDEEMEVCEDYDLWLRILKSYEIPLIEDELTIKHAGREDQLSMRYWDLDRWHIRSLLKHTQERSVREMIASKCEGLKKASLKYNDTALMNECNHWLRVLEKY